MFSSVRDKSFIDNGVRLSVIPFCPLPGGGPQVVIMGILEYLSLSNTNTDFLDLDEKLKFIDDCSFLEMVNLILYWLSSYNFKQNIASNIGIH